MRRLHPSLSVNRLLAVLITCLALLPYTTHAGPNIEWANTNIVQVILLAPQQTTFLAEPDLKNVSLESGNFTISFLDKPESWDIAINTTQPISITKGSSVKISMRITVPGTTTPGLRILTVRATHEKTRISEDLFLRIDFVKNASPPAAQGICPEPVEPGGDLKSAYLLRVDLEEPFGICQVGDEDWFKFAALGGKYYTIDVPTMDPGLDLAMELYDASGRLLDANDDYPRDGDVTKYDPRPKIVMFRAPASGYYYIRLRDALGLGGKGLGYRIVVKGEGYGRNPPPISSICNDVYEPDGLPEQAYPINPNETQKDHRLCPRGDADWVKFFGLSGYTYYLYTNSKGADGAPVPGADPILYLFSRDGQTAIDANNNIPGGTSLDALVSFRPAADGIYYAQVKNVGDIGDNRIAYSLTLKACPTEQTSCAPPPDVLPPKTPAAPPAATAPPPAAQAPPASPAAPPQFLDSSNPQQREEFSTTPEALGSVVTVKPMAVIDPAFEQLWQRNDLPVAGGRANRSWLWGPAARLARGEAYTETRFGLRQVLYFDKGRMELTNPNGDRTSRWYISSGLLVHELVSGHLQIGDASYSERAPAQIGLVGDLNDDRAPTYASLTNLVGPVAARTGTLPTEILHRDGGLSTYAGPERTETRLSRYVGETGHNIPAIFWDYMTARGVVYESGRFRSTQLFDWVTMLGYPISEPYWTHVRVGGVERDVLVQAFERRVLTYTPDESTGWRVQIGNVGRHYYSWRYGEDLPGS